MGERVAVVLGVSGSGKTTVASALAERLGWPFAEADEFHPPANVAKMMAGNALDDSDRAPWLQALREWVAERERLGESAVMTCSCLKRAYRDVLAEGHPSVFFVQLEVSTATLQARLDRRTGHFMPPSLLGSQVQTLEPLEPDERGVIVPADGPPDVIVDRVRASWT